MNLILDTHVLLWWLNDDPALSAESRRLVGNPENLAFVSAVVIWEIRIKEGLGKLTIPNNFREVLDKQPFHSLDVTAEHAHALSDLPSHHRDPFDRMLIAQARVERMTLVTRDPRFAAYEVSLVTI